MIPPDRVRYLAEIVENSEQYDEFVRQQVDIARRMYQIKGTIDQLRSEVGTKTIEIVEPGADGVVEAIEDEAEEPEYLRDLIDRYDKLESSLDPECKQQLRDWPSHAERYKADRYRFQVRGRTIEQDLYSESLSHLRIPKVSLPRYRGLGRHPAVVADRERTGDVPLRRGSLPSQRQTEDPTRMFAGEGGPESTNRRFHYLSHNMPAKRCRRPSIRSHSTVRIPITDPISTARSATRVSAWRLSTTPRSSIRASIWRIRPPPSP